MERAEAENQEVAGDETDDETQEGQESSNGEGSEKSGEED